MSADIPAQPLSLSYVERAVAVEALNARFGKMEGVVWCLSKHCRQPLIDRTSAPVVDTLVWTVRTWTGVQGPTLGTKRLISRALSEMSWSWDLFGAPAQLPADAEEYAYNAVSTLVKKSMALGVPRREFSLCSKVLHWLLPRRVPVMTAS